MAALTMPCYCGHDCARCYIYLATVGGDPKMRDKAKKFYKSEFGIDLPDEKIRCLGGRSEEIFYLCEGCPFRKCCRGRSISGCGECGEQCAAFIEYTRRYVNKCGQAPDNVPDK